MRWSPSSCQVGICSGGHGMGAGAGDQAVEADLASAALSAVGEEDEVSIQEAAEAVVEAMDFHGEVTVS